MFRQRPMELQYTPYTAPVFLSAVVGLGVGAFAFQHRERPGAFPLAVFMIGASAWSFAEGMNLAAAGLGPKVFWTRLEIAASCVVPLAWLALVLEYTGNDQWITRRTVALLLVEPAVFVGVLWAEPSLVRTGLTLDTSGSFAVITESIGPVFYAHLIYSYLLLLIGGALLLRVILFAEGVYRTQATALLVALFVPLVGNVLYVFEYLPAGVDPTNVGFLFSGIIVAGTILRGQLLEVVPVARHLARDEILENMEDRVIVLDDTQRIADVNPAAAELFDRSEAAAVGERIETLLPDLSALLDDETGTHVQTELSLEGEEGVRYYNVRISPLHRARGAVAGTLVSLRDVTDKRQQRQRLEVLNRLLRHNLRNEMNVVAGNAELVERQLADPDLRERLDLIAETATRITDQSDKVGQVSRTFDEDGTVTVDLRETVTTEVQDARDRYPVAEITLELPAELDVGVDPAIAIALDELLANAVEHNDHDDPTVNVLVRDEGDVAVLEVADDGPGIDPHELAVLEEGEETALKHGSGVGLWVVYWTVEQFGGRLEFENDDHGCTVTAWLPDTDEADDSGTERTAAVGGLRQALDPTEIGFSADD
ncbi:histidine kinase N-terminal 7TM domain-containing protein [Halorientalis pallida]|uniref:PAS domain S-box protein n=1 Tax=Halorientalis pallida TaxID=2479928 RepID=A0A498L9I3_9EURY|nr:histidine kinase N-terminal 7TM domain-containing protein [Halorientalis pallida]RXK51843.1 PAS domain S-box protein [Halorientalis pallida]